MGPAAEPMVSDQQSTGSGGSTLSAVDATAILEQLAVLQARVEKLENDAMATRHRRWGPNSSGSSSGQQQQSQQPHQQVLVPVPEPQPQQTQQQQQLALVQQKPFWQPRVWPPPLQPPACTNPYCRCMHRRNILNIGLGAPARNHVPPGGIDSYLSSLQDTLFFNNQATFDRLWRPLSQAHNQGLISIIFCKTQAHRFVQVVCVMCGSYEHADFGYNNSTPVEQAEGRATLCEFMKVPAPQAGDEVA